MEITIRIDGAETSTTPGQQSSSGQDSAAAAAETLARAAAIGAINAGPAPSGPGATTGPSIFVGSPAHVTEESQGSSAGPAPDLR